MGNEQAKLADERATTAIYTAAASGDVAQLEQILAKYPRLVDTPNNNNGWTPLFVAAFGGHVDAIELLVRLGSKAIDTTDNSGWTPMHTAASRGHVSVIEALVRLGSKTIDTPNNQGRTPLYAAAWNGHASVIETLVRLGSKAIDTPGDDGRAPLNTAIEQFHIECTQLLVHLGARHNGPIPASRLSQYEQLSQFMDEDAMAATRYRVYFATSLTCRLLDSL